MPLTAIYDACVLYPAPLRDLLIHLARTGLFRARWTERIQNEWVRSLLENRPDLDPARLKRTCQLMNESVLDCLVRDYEDLIPSVPLNDPDDQHVFAAAIKSRAEIIVTFNLRDFPESALSPHKIEAQHPDLFVQNLLSVDETLVCEAVRIQRSNLRNPPKSAQELLDTFWDQGLKETAIHFRSLIDQI